MEGKNEQMDKADEVILPGFRFHPTDEELVGFYLKRKVQQKPLSIELIRLVDIYKYDPWDLPKLAATGEKEWYFYCPRDKKYRNSTRPNRVTGAGFWKATGTDRPIYSSEGTKCIGLKKSLVFYKGRAAKGVKTDWMMHEFRLPSLTDPLMPKIHSEKNIVPANDSWAICRIFKKTNPSARRALPHSWVSPSPGNLFQFSNSEADSCTNEINGHVAAIQQVCRNNSTMAQLQQQYSDKHLGFPCLDLASADKPKHLPYCAKSSVVPTLSSTDISGAGFALNPADMTTHLKCSVDATTPLLYNIPPMLLGKASTSEDFANQEQQIFVASGGLVPLTVGMDGRQRRGREEEGTSLRENGIHVSQGSYGSHWGGVRPSNFPLTLPSSNLFTDAWRPNLVSWESITRSCEMALLPSTSYSGLSKW